MLSSALTCWAKKKHLAGLHQGLFFRAGPFIASSLLAHPLQEPLTRGFRSLRTGSECLLSIHMRVQPHSRGSWH
eukprot:888541-Amphidinium_carterae.1